MLFKSKVIILGKPACQTRQGGRREGFFIEGFSFFPADGRGGTGVTVGDGINHWNLAFSRQACLPEAGFAGSRLQVTGFRLCQGCLFGVFTLNDKFNIQNSTFKIFRISWDFLICCFIGLVKGFGRYK